MADRDWLNAFLLKVAYDPRLLIRTIAFARKTELPAVAAALELVESPPVKIFGFAALARRYPADRDAFLPRSAVFAQALEDPVARTGVLMALIDVLPHIDASYFTSLLASDIASLEESDRNRFAKLFEKRNPRFAPERDLVTSLPQPRIEIDFDLDEIATSIARASERKPKKYTWKIETLGPRSGVHKIRLNEIGQSLGIDPRSFDFTAVASASPPFELTLPDAKPAASASHRERIVSTGFADERGELAHIVVEPSSVHRYFIEIGARIEGAPDTEHSLADDLEGEIDVVMYTNADGLELAGAGRGRFIIKADGTIRVSQRAAAADAADELLDRRMFFAFRAPATETTCSMRCSFYSRGLLIQSRNIVIPVGTGKPPVIHADYVLSRTLSPNYVAQMKPPLLSVMLNENANGTQSFRFYGKNGELTNSSTFGERELESHIALARAALRMAAWGTEEEWKPENKYRFASSRTVTTIMRDLIELAWQGRVLWDATIDRLAGGPAASEKLQRHMIAHGDVQFALKEAANQVLPLALFYDHAFDSAVPRETIKLCPTFITSLGNADLADEPCFNGGCPNRDAIEIVCPGGFWGFRHAIGLPPSIGAQQTSPQELPAFITGDAPSFLIGVSTDPEMSSRVRHIPRLKAVAPQEVFETRKEVLEAMAVTRAPVVYFYCHGGKHKIEGPYIQVGPKEGPRIARMNLRGIKWEAPRPRPLVFINGCRTTSVTPEEALNLVNPLVTNSGASGVIGTEITVFESLATAFAEAFFEEFVVKKHAAGEAVRRARLQLLKKKRNPLGLVYIPFVLPGLCLRPPVVPQSYV